MYSRILLIIITAFGLSCERVSETTDKYSVPSDVSPEMIEMVPEWAKSAVWYQIFVERFRDGDARNQPTLQGIQGSWPHDKPENWAPTRWTQDWYAMEEWAQQTGKPFYETVHMRRYGGDLQGVLDKLDYLADLGITAIYFNPLNDSPSLHKYDVRNYHHIDIFFGPDPQGDADLIASEDPSDPSTWVWTSADRLFLDVIREAKLRGIRIIMDYSWNHTGITFWAWQDVLKKQRESRFADWYRIDSFDDPQLGTTFAFSGWAGVPELPEFRRHGTGADLPVIHSELAPADLHPSLKRHIFAVTRRWMDPAGNGDISLGVDGFRLDVAELIPAAFWRDYRTFVRSINPEAFLIGELWWDSWPDKLLDPNPWLQGDIFDAHMNYRWYMPTRSFFGRALPEVSLPSQYVHHLDSVSRGASRDVLYAQMNLTSSHDSPRFMTSMANRGVYKYRVNPRENPDYFLRRANMQTMERMHLVLLKQFTDVGAPHIWMGDEMGMWAADDPDTRKPLIWPDLTFDAESADPFARARPTETVAFDAARHAIYKSLISLRSQHPVLVSGGKSYTLADDTRNLLAFERYDGEKVIIVLFNNSDQRHQLTWEPARISTDQQLIVNQGSPAHDMDARGRSYMNPGTLRHLYNTGGVSYEFTNGTILLDLPARSGIVVIRE
jgi:cyclomaltodextrinase / maltogenic alpha-amylase / neopullulanase